MKRAGRLLAALALIIIMPVTALAEGETPSPSDDGDSEPTAVILEIDNEHVYEGMDKAYQDGYTPAVQNGTAIILLPLIANGDIQGSAVTATPNLGDTSSSPFVYSNYQKTVSLQDNSVEGGDAVPSYLVRFDLSLTSGRLNGVYPVTTDVTATAMDGSLIQRSFTTYVTITDGEDPNAEQPEPSAETPVSQPKIIVSGYAINPSPVTAGDEFAATITLQNTSEKQSVQNMSVTVSCDSSNLVLQNESDVIYIGRLAKDAETDIRVTYRTDLETPPQRYNIMLNIEYDNSDAQTFSSSGTVLVNVIQPLRVEMEVPQVPESVNAGDTIPLSFQVMNMGRSQVYNVRIELDAPGLIPTGTAFIGNMEAGTSMTGEMDVFVGTKNMSEGYEGDDKYGYTSGTVTLIYEDAEGQEYTDDAELSTTINQPVIAPASAEPDEEPEKAGQWWISVVIGAAVIAGLATFLIVRNRKGKRHEDF